MEGGCVEVRGRDELPVVVKSAVAGAVAYMRRIRKWQGVSMMHNCNRNKDVVDDGDAMKMVYAMDVCDGDDIFVRERREEEERKERRRK